MAASLLIQGTIVSHTNLTGDETPRLHPAVQAFLDALPAGLREPFIGYCAESALVSDQLWALDRQRADRGSTSLAEARDHFAGSALVAKKIRAQGDPEHGTPARVCRSCSALLDELGVDVIGS